MKRLYFYLLTTPIDEEQIFGFWYEDVLDLQAAPLFTKPGF
jgi:hypothetical protein